MREVVISIAELGEFGLIDAITGAFGSAARGLAVGVGDDAAVVGAPDGRVVATTDMVIEGRHFRRDWSSAADVGHKAAARNLADVAAMGAVPTALLIGFAGPGDLPVDWVLKLAGGIAAECSAAGAKIAGGDTSRADLVILSITALGDLGGAAPVTRGGACPGDVVAVAGAGAGAGLGGAAAGLALLRAGAAASSPPLLGLVSAHRRPHPPYSAGPQAARLGATSMIDVSDGLIADLGHIADASGVLIELSSRLVAAPPVASPDALRLAAGELGVADWLPWVLTGGDDHALVATFPASVALPAGWTEVGKVAKGHGIAIDGRIWTEAGGWDHFRS
jgi:thiamine-monophosphate kinase